MNHWTIYLLPFISAFTGWLIIWIAVKLLFRPISPKQMFGIRIQGIFPSQQPKIGAALGALAAKELRLDEIIAKVKDPQQLQALRPHIEGHVDHYLKHKLAEKLPVISMFVGAGTLDKIKEGLLEEIDVLLPEIIGRYADNMGRQIDIEDIVKSRMNRLSATELEQMLNKTKGLRALFILGTATGFLMGLIQMLLLLL